MVRLPQTVMLPYCHRLLKVPKLPAIILSKHPYRLKPFSVLILKEILLKPKFLYSSSSYIRTKTYIITYPQISPNYQRHICLLLYKRSV